MIADLKPYAECKESGLPWLGRVPSSWRVIRNGCLFGQRNETGHGELPILEVSLKTGIRVRRFVSSVRKQVISDKGKYKLAVKGDLPLCQDSCHLGPIAAGRVQWACRLLMVW